MSAEIRRPLRCTTQIRVRFAETDAAGIVHYAQYLGYLEAGRAEALRSAGLSSERIAVCSVQLRLRQAVIRYRSPAHFDELLEISTWVSKLLDSQVGFDYEIQRASDRVVIAEAQTLHDWTDPGVSKCATPPDWLLGALDQVRG
jgi:acyl-CoA thioester hydrolase